MEAAALERGACYSHVLGECADGELEGCTTGACISHSRVTWSTDATQVAARMHKQFQEDRFLYWSVFCAVLQVSGTLSLHRTTLKTCLNIRQMMQPLHPHSSLCCSNSPCDLSHQPLFRHTSARIASTFTSQFSRNYRCTMRQLSFWTAKPARAGARRVSCAKS